MNSPLRFDGRVAVITGAASGLGRAYAVELAARGAIVVVNDLPAPARGPGTDRFAGVVSQITDLGGVVHAIPGDVSSQRDMEYLVESAVAEFGRIDILVNNAGAPGRDAFTSRKEWDRLLAVNLHGTVNTLRAAWPHFEAQDFGRVVNTTSSSVLGTPNSGAYAAAKGGVLALTKVLASTYPDRNIKVNAIMPIAGTEMTDRVRDDVYRVWLREHFDPEKVAAFIPLLCRDDLDFSGETFTVGGGRAARVLFETTAGWFTPEPTAESFLANLGDVMAGRDARFATSGQGDLIRYVDLLGDRGPF